MTNKKELQEKLAEIVAFEATRDYTDISDNDARMAIKQMQKTFNFAKQLQANTDVDVIDEYVDTKFGQTANDAGKLLEKLGFEYTATTVWCYHKKTAVENGVKTSYTVYTRLMDAENIAGLELLLNALQNLIENGTYDDIVFNIERIA